MGPFLFFGGRSRGSRVRQFSGSHGLRRMRRVLMVYAGWDRVLMVYAGWDRVLMVYAGWDPVRM